MRYPTFARLAARGMRLALRGLAPRAKLPAAAPKPAPTFSASFVRASYTNRWGTRFYKTYIPARNARQLRPLVVMLHGCRQTLDDFAAGTRMNELADELGFLVVYPEQAPAANPARCWNWFQPADQRRDAGEPSLIAGITEAVIARHGADPRRVYVAGLSAGGAMAAVMGRTYPDLYAAVGVHSGLPYAAARDLPSALAAMRGAPAPLSGASIRTIVFHGDGDTTVHPSNGEFLAPGASLQTVQRGEERGRKYTRMIHVDAAGKPAREHWLVHGAGHAWSGGSVKGSYTDPKGPDATRAMLRFFLP